MSDIILPQDVPIGTEVTVVWTGYKRETTKGTRTRYERIAPPVVVPPPVEPPPDPQDGAMVFPGQDIKAMLASGERIFVLRNGTHRLSFGSSETQYANVSISAYPGEKPVIDGTGLDPHFVYLGPQSGTWKLTDIALRNFFPTGSGVIGIGDGCRLEMTRVSMVGKGGAASNQDHGVYFHGTGTGLLVECGVANFPGSALQSYRGSPQVEVQRGIFHGLYVGVFCYSGHMAFNGTDIRGSGVWDVDNQLPATVALVGCTGRGSDGKPKVTVHT